MRPGPAERGGGGGGGAAELMAGGARPGLSRTPTPYLLLGFGLMIGLIVLALLVLICTRRRDHSSSSTSSRREAAAHNNKAESVPGVMVPLDPEAPRVVVFMAGDALPSFLASAKPLAFPAPRRAGAELAAV